MLSIAKVSLMGEFSLLTLKRYVQRDTDKSYQLAIEDYCAKLQQLYQSILKERQQTLIAQKRAVESESFRLNRADGQLNGITIKRGSLPYAELEDQVILVQHDDASPLAYGVIVKITSQKIRIKFREQLFKDELNADTTIDGRVESQENAATTETQKGETNEKESSARVTSDQDAGKEIDKSSKFGDHNEENNQDKELPVNDSHEEDKKDNEERTSMLVEGHEEGKENRELAPVADGEDKEETSSQAKEDKEVEKNSTVDFKIRFVLDQDHIPNKRDSHSSLIIKSVLNSFRKLKCNQAIQRNLLGFYDERNDTLTDRARVMTFTEPVIKLNNQQRAAIEHALTRRLALIEGPAGTGKTLIAAHIAANIGRQRRGRVLVCSPIRETIDRLTEFIDDVGSLQVVKLPQSSQSHFANKTHANGLFSDTLKGRRRDSYLNAELKHSNRCHLDKLVDDEIYLQAYARFKSTLNSNNHEKLHANAYRMVTSCTESRRRELESRIISKANVVCCHINQTAISLLEKIEFDMLIIDDVQVTSELDCLIAIMTKGIKQVVLISDIRQDIRLARVPIRSQSMCRWSNGANTRQQDSNSAKRKRQSSVRRARQTSTLSENIDTQSRGNRIYRSTLPLNPSLEPGNLFERLLSMGLSTVDMRVQYRCHATISHFFNHYFYAGRLKDNAETNDAMSTEIVTHLVINNSSFSWLPNKEYLTAMYKVPSFPVTASIINLSQVEIERSNVIEAKVKEVVDNLMSERNIRKGVYSVGIIYNNQALAHLAKTSHTSVKVGTIEKFIGQEKDFIVLVASDSVGTSLLNIANIGICSAIPCDFRQHDTVLNWALTRAKLGLFIIAQEQSSCSKNGEIVNDIQTTRNDDCNSWRALVKYYACANLIVG